MKLLSQLATAQATVKKIWKLAAPYFHSEQKWKARALLAGIVLLNLAAVFMLVQLNDWNRVFYDALEKRDQTVFWQQLGRFTYLAFAFIVIAVYRFYLTQLLEVRWRTWMTAHYLERWLSNHAFYKMELARYATTSPTTATPDNPDQRIQEDLNLFTTYSVSLSMGLLNAVVTLVSFVGILWGLSGAFSFTLSGSTYEIPGFMVWMAVLYCVVGSVLTHQGVLTTILRDALRIKKALRKARNAAGVSPGKASQRRAVPFWPQPEGNGVKTAPLVVALLGKAPALPSSHA